MDSVRTWGDGGGRTAEHVIADISFSDFPMWVVCENDGERMEGLISSALNVVWDLHRGLQPETVRRRGVRGALATDDEVSDFLKHLDDPRYASHYGTQPVAALDDGLDDAFALLARLKQLGEACTCATSEVLLCPNYETGDEA